MANLYNVPLQNGIQLTTSSALLTGVTSSITFTVNVNTLLQASSSIKGILVIDRIDSQGNETPAKTEYISFEGVSTNTVTTLVRGLAGTTDQDHSAGAIVEFVPDVVWADAINDVFTEQHTATGNHKVLDWATATDSATITFDLTTYKKQRVTLGGNRTLALSNVGNGDAFIVSLGQDGTGSRTVTWFSTIKWDNGVTPTLTSTASKMDVFGFIQTASNQYLGFTVGQNL